MHTFQTHTRTWRKKLFQFPWLWDSIIKKEELLFKVHTFSIYFRLFTVFLNMNIFLFHQFPGSKLIDVLKKDFTTIIINPAKYDANRLKDMADKAKKQYLGDKPVSVEAVEKIADVSSIYWSIIPCIASDILHPTCPTF